MNRIIIGHLNINSLRNKFEQLKNIIKGKIDILVITETKIDNSFPTSQFYIEGYSKPFRLDRNATGGGVIIFLREDIPTNVLQKHTFGNDIESIVFEINLY